MDGLCVEQVAEAIKIVLKSSQPNLVVKLDMQRIEALHMGISADSVQLSILNHPKIKLKSEVSTKLFDTPDHQFFLLILFIVRHLCSMFVLSINPS